MFLTTIFVQLLVSANENEILEGSLATILISNVIHHFTYLLRGFSSFITYLLSFFVPLPVSVIGYWGYKNKRIHVLKDSLVLGQADTGLF